MCVATGRKVEVDCLASIRSALVSIIDELALSNISEPIVLPELTYPFHPSTGLVANPDVVDALVTTLQSSFDTDVGIIYTGSKYADGSKTALLVGYDSITDNTGVEVVNLNSADAVEQTVHLDGGPRTVNVPKPLLERPVIVVPTLRYGSDQPIVGGMETVSRATRISTTVASSVSAAALAVDPAAVVLDATYTFTGQPHRTGIIIGGSDVVDMEALGARLTDTDTVDVPSLAAVPGDTPAVSSLRSLSMSSIRDSLPNLPPPENDTPGPVLREGYRLYTQLTGDAYPPQFDA